MAGTELLVAFLVGQQLDKAQKGSKGMSVPVRARGWPYAAAAACSAVRKRGNTQFNLWVCTGCCRRRPNLLLSGAVRYRLHALQKGLTPKAIEGLCQPACTQHCTTVSDGPVALQHSGTVPSLHAAPSSDCQGTHCTVKATCPV